MFPTALFAAACDKGGFFGLVPWYKYLKYGTDPDTGSCAVLQFNVLPSGSGSSDLPLVLLAVVDDLLRIAGLVAVIFIVYGAVMYTTSQGNPDQTSKAQSTIINALAGLVLAMIAVGIVSFIGSKLGV